MSEQPIQSTDQSIESSQPVSNRPRLGLLIFLIIPIIGLIIAATIAFRQPQAASELQPDPSTYVPQTLIGAVAPEGNLQTLEATPFDLRTTRGKWVLLNFWATWCGPCVEEMPTLQKVNAGEFDSDKVRLSVLAVNRQEDASTIRAFLDENKIDLPIAVDETGRFSRAYAITNLPRTFILDPDGVIRYQVIGMMRPEAIRKYIEDIELKYVN